MANLQRLAQQLFDLQQQLSNIAQELNQELGGNAGSVSFHIPIPTKETLQPASDKELDGPYGNPEVRFNPKRWEGADCVGRKYSECPAEFLYVMSDFLLWSAKKSNENNEKTNKGKPIAEFRLRDAARALGWAQRNARTASPPPAQRPPSGVTQRGSMADPPDDEDIPF